MEGDTDGGNQITSYVIQWDAGDDTSTTFTALVGESIPSLELSHTIHDDIESGKSYRFNYYAINLHGAGPVSDTLIVQAANNPARMEAPIVTLEPGLIYKVSFIAPYSGGVGITIEEYEIVIRQKDGTFTMLSQCDGTSLTV